MKVSTFAGAAVLSLTLAACRSEEPEAAHPPAQPSTMSPQLPAGHPPIDGAPSGGSAGALPAGHPAINSAVPPPDPSAAQGLKWTDPSGWTRQPPASAMRQAQYGVPKAAGDTEDAELQVFHFGGGQGGAVQSNVDRWMGQFGATTPTKSEKRTVGTIPVTVVSVEGTYDGGMAMMGAGNTGPKQNWALIGAIAETPSGPWFFKLVGPKATIASARAAFDQLVGSLKVE
jgi:hypothetical protein